jgi:hypothetical protein
MNWSVTVAISLILILEAGALFLVGRRTARFRRLSILGQVVAGGACSLIAGWSVVVGVGHGVSFGLTTWWWASLRYSANLGETVVLLPSLWLSPPLLVVGFVLGYSSNYWRLPNKPLEPTR